MIGRLVMVAAAGLGAGVVGCAVSRPAPAATRPAATRPVRAATRPAAAAARGGVYEGKGVRVGWPGGWERMGSEDYVVMLRGPGRARISLDVPELPAHVPGWIPLGMVVKGYEDDLKKQVGKVEERELAKPGGALGDKVRMVRSGWDGRQETAVIVVHGDRVYILRGRSDAAHEKVTREAMGEMVGSWRWE